MIGYTDALDFLVVAPDALTFLLAGIDAVGLIGGFPVAHGMRYLRNGFGLFPVIAVGTHIALFTEFRAGGIVCGDPLVIMAGYTDALGFLVGTPGALALFLAGIDTIGFIRDLPVTHIMTEFLDGFGFFPVVAVGTHITFFTGLRAGGIVRGDPLIGMGFQGNSLGFLIGTIVAFAFLLAGIDTI